MAYVSLSDGEGDFDFEERAADFGLRAFLRLGVGDMRGMLPQIGGGKKRGLDKDNGNGENIHTEGTARKDESTESARRSPRVARARLRGETRERDYLGESFWAAATTGLIASTQFRITEGSVTTGALEAGDWKATKCWPSGATS